MSNDLDPSLFHHYFGFRPKRKSLRAEKTLAIGATERLAVVKGQKGRFNFVQLVTETDDLANLKIIIDGQIIFDYAHTHIEDDGSGKLSIPLLYNISIPFGVTRTDAGGYGIYFNGAMMKVEFEDSMEVLCVNEDTSTVNINSFYVLYDIAKLCAVRK